MIIPKQSGFVVNCKFARDRKGGLTPRFVRSITLLAAAFLMLRILVLPLLPAQTAATGSIAGFVTDNKRAFIVGAPITITNRVTSASLHLATSTAGAYSSGPIQPGDYLLRVEAKGFATAQFLVAVHVGNTTTVNVTMLPPPPKAPVPGGAPVNNEQPAVQTVVGPVAVQKYPITGRNLVDLAQFEPDVQTQDAAVLDPGKNGISATSLLNHYGRATQVKVDGVDISDEVVGAPSQNIPAGAIREFQIAQSSLDISTGLTSDGAINIITRSGSDQIHGGIFGIYRGDQGAAALPGTPTNSFQRIIYEGNAGGAIIKDKVFLFADAERTQQNLTAGQPFTFPFNGFGETLNEPYREFNTDERVDWNMRGSTRAFYRLNYFQNTDTRPYGSFSSTQNLRSDNNVLTNALGVDFTTGVYLHSLRFEYLKLRSGVNDAAGTLSGIENPIPGLGINIGAYVAGNCSLSNGGSYCGGPGWLGPQATYQSDKLARYDGTRVLGAHIIRFGAEFNRIDGARRVSHSLFPQVGTTSLGTSTSPDPTSYPADYVTLGNGIEFTTPSSAFGLPGGGLGPDNRLQLYVADSWKTSPRFTLTYGMHYVRDTGRTDSGLGALPALNAWGAGYGGQVRNPNINFAPQFGFAWDASGNGNLVIRGGGGLFYDTSLWSNMLFDSPARRLTGNYASAPEICSGGVAEPFAWPSTLVTGSSVAGGAATAISPTNALPAFCGGTISTVAPQILALSSAYQSAAAAVPQSQANGAFVGTSLQALNTSYDLLYPGYLTPRAWQVNFGIEDEVHPGTVVSIDYIRNIGEHFLIGRDINQSGSARSFNQANALAARDAAQIANGCSPGLAQATCMINKLGQLGAQAAYSAAGLDSNLQAAGGGPCSYCAFPGINPITGNLGTVGGVDMLFPGGRSLYSGFEGRWLQRMDRPFRGVKVVNFQVSYTYSKFTSQLQDQDFPSLALDNNNPTFFTGPTAMDRKHQVSFAGVFNLPLNLRAGVAAHFFSPLAQNLLLPEVTNGGEIYATDWLGAGLNSQSNPEPVPGTNVGQFERGTNMNTLPGVISTYNHTYAGRLTPAGECLVANAVPGPFTCTGLISAPAVMTSADMSALGWVMPTVDSVADKAVGIPWLKTMDLRLAWPFTYKDRITIEPSATVLNVFNFWNAYLPGNLPGASLLPGQNGILAPNVVGGVTPGANLAPFRNSFQSGTFALGAPRQLEFQLRISF